MCDPKHDIGSFDPEAEAQDGFARNVRELIPKELDLVTIPFCHSKVRGVETDI